MLNISIILIAASIILCLLAIFLITYFVRKHKINKKLKDDCEILAKGGTPNGAERHQSQSFAILSSVSIALGITMIIVFFATQITNIKYDLNNLNNNYNYRINTLIEEIKELKTEIQKSESNIMSFNVKHDESSFNPATMTEDIIIEVIPKSIGNSTNVKITINGQSYTTIKENDLFKLIYKKNIFEYIDDKNIYVSIENEGFYQNEIINKDLYGDTDDIFYPTYYTYFPNINNITYDLDHAKEATLKNGWYEIDNTMNIKINKGIGNITNVSLKLLDGDEIIYEQDITSYIVNNEKLYELNNVNINQKINNIKSDYVDLLIEITNSYGYTVVHHNRTFENGYVYMPAITILDSNGTLVSSSK